MCVSLSLSLWPVCKMYRGRGAGGEGAISVSGDWRRGLQGESVDCVPGFGGPVF